MNDGKAMTTTLRAPEPGDLDAMYRWCNDPGQWHNSLSDAVVSRHRLWQYLQGFDDDIAAQGQVRFVVMHGDRAVGTVDLCDYNARNATAFAGIYIEEAWRGRGIGQAALGLLLDLAARRYALRTVAAFVAADNAASLAVFEKAGFNRAGVLQNWLRPPGAPDAVIMQKIIGG